MQNSSLQWSRNGLALECTENGEKRSQIIVMTPREFKNASENVESFRTTIPDAVIIDDAQLAGHTFWRAYGNVMENSSGHMRVKTHLFSKEQQFISDDFSVYLQAVGVQDSGIKLDILSTFEDTDCARNSTKELGNDIVLTSRDTIAKVSGPMPDAKAKVLKPISKELLKTTTNSQRKNKRKINHASKLMHLASFDPRLLPPEEFSLKKTKLCSSDVYEQRPQDVIEYLQKEDKAGMKTAIKLIEGAAAKKEACCICLETMETPAITDCNHMFCMSCISQSMRRASKSAHNADSPSKS